MKIRDLIIAKSDVIDYLTGLGATLRGNGQKRCACPVHRGSREDSMLVTPPTVYCFACGFGGTIIDLVMETETLNYREAIEKLAELYNIPLDKDEDYQKVKTHVERSQKYVELWHKDLPKVIEYLTKVRGLKPETIDNFMLGHHDGDVTIPFRDEHGQYVALSRRHFKTGKAKYTNSKNNEFFEKGSMLYNIDRAKKLMRKQNRLFVCEGYFDCMVADEQGLPAAAYIGATLTKEQVNLIQRLLINDKAKNSFTVYVAPDNDEEGQKRIPSIRDKFLQFAPKLNVRIVHMPDGEYTFSDGTRKCKDFNDVHLQGISIEGLATEHIDMYVIKKLLAECADPETEYTVAFDFCRTVKNAMVRGDIARFLADRWKKPAEVDEIRKWLDAAKDPDSLKAEFKQPTDAIQELKELLKEGQMGLGLPAIDAALAKVRKTEVVIIAGYAGTKKTWLAITAALHIAVKENRRVIFFSMEMSAAALYSRLIAMFLGKPVEEIEKLLLQDDTLVLKVQMALQQRLFVVDTNRLSIKDIRERIAFANTRLFDKPCDAIIVDYLQYMDGANKFETFSENIQDFKAIAKEYNLVPVLLSQLNRSGNQYERPTLNLLKGGGDVEATGDSVLAAYSPGDNPKLPIDQAELLANETRVVILKHRRGAKAFEFAFEFNPLTTRFEEKNLAA